MTRRHPAGTVTTRRHRNRNGPTGNRQTTAVGLMLGSVLGHSLLPLLVDLSGDRGSVALVVGMWTLVFSCGHGAAARWLGRDDGSGVSSKRLLREIPWWAYTISFVAAFQWVFFAWSARLTETAVTTMIVECWVLLFLLGRKTFAAGDGKQTVSVTGIGLAVVAVVGLGLVVFSNASDSNVSVSLWGPVLAVVALVLTSTSLVVNIKTSEVVAGRLAPYVRGGDARLKTRVSTTQTGVARAAAGVTLLVVGTVQAGSVGNVPVSALMFGVGLGVVHSPAAVFFLAANHSSRSDLVNSIFYATPVLGLLWLWVFTEVTINEPAMFIAGVAVIVGANATIHLPSLNGSQATATT